MTLCLLDGGRGVSLAGQAPGLFAFFAIARADTLSPSCSSTSGPGADERDPGPGACPRERRVFRQKPVPGVDGIDADFLGELHDAGNVQVRP